MKRRNLIKILFLGLMIIPEKGMTTLSENIKTKLISCLRSIGTKKCLEVAVQVENSSSKEIKLELRDAGIKVAHLKQLSEVLSSFIGEDIYHLTTLSFSYNSIGDEGVSYLSTSMPYNLCELGLVDCSLTDAGGKKLLEWLRKSTELKLLCIENNKFTVELRTEIREWAKDKEGLHLVV